ncbi:MAG: glutamate formimidoyltransferase [Gemmatimonadota bacterium]|nr:glutamate formimidoyltransferase [Gemmatimonadota bacterium]
MPALIEAVPNFSEGRDPEVIRRIVAQIAAVEGVTVLNVDPGKATNRTVVTVVGEPEAVAEGAFQGIRAAAELIDMRHHTGEHPRMGATDVCPLIPISGISMAECAALARTLAERVGRELAIPVYLYEAAQPDASRRNLADIRAGEYEGFARKIKEPAWKPDFGPAELPPRHGATVIGARDFLVAFNVNLNTTSTRRANAIAFDVREAGRPRRSGHPLTGPIERDPAGTPLTTPGSLKAVKAIGWYIEEYGVAQVSMNLVDLKVTPIHVAFDEVVARAAARGVRVTGSELVGLVPLAAMLEAGRHYLRQQQRSIGVGDAELIRIAVRSMGLNELAPFDPAERIIEYQLGLGAPGPLVSLTVAQFVAITASESVAPGGGSVAALVGALGAALGTMVANLSAHKRGWDERWEEFSSAAEGGHRATTTLLALVDEDTRAFNEVMVALSMPKATAEEKLARANALQAANLEAARVPLRVAEAACAAMPFIRTMTETGNPASASDGAVGGLCARTAVLGACLNVRTNLPGIASGDDRRDLEEAATRLEETATRLEAEILAIARSKIG